MNFKIGDKVKVIKKLPSIELYYLQVGTVTRNERNVIVDFDGDIVVFLEDELQKLTKLERALQ